MLSLLQKELIKAMKAKEKPTIIGFRNIIGKLKAKKFGYISLEVVLDL